MRHSCGLFIALFTAFMVGGAAGAHSAESRVAGTSKSFRNLHRKSPPNSRPLFPGRLRNEVCTSNRAPTTRSMKS